MENTIDRTFFFFHQKMDSLLNINISKKTSYIVAPLLPVGGLLLSVKLVISVSWMFTLLLIALLIMTFMLSFVSFNFLKGQNIFIIHKLLRVLNSSIKNHPINDNLDLLFFTGKRLEFKLEKENTRSIEVKTISFSEAQSEMITKAFNILTKEIISDDNTLKGFIEAIKYSGLKEVEQIKLELESKYCAVFLRTFFIPYVMILTNRELTLAEASKLFIYKKKDSYRPVIADSISKKPRQLSTQYQRITYKTLLDELKKVS